MNKFEVKLKELQEKISKEIEEIKDHIKSPFISTNSVLEELESLHLKVAYEIDELKTQQKCNETASSLDSRNIELKKASYLVKMLTLSSQIAQQIAEI